MLPQRLEPIRRLLGRFGDPQDALRVIHVAGTNGKGSVCCFLACLLAAGGRRVGRFSSPHLLEPCDAVRIDEGTIDRAVYERLHAAVAAASADCSLFEQQTATAFLAFRELAVDVAVVEVGMGGLLDATNVVADPLATVVTPIGHDHMPQLGTTIAEVAAQKAGILKAGRPCVLAPQEYPEAAAVVRATALRLGCPLVEVTDAPDLDLPLKGIHQRWNFAVARATLRAAGMDVEDAAVPEALRRVWWPGRLQRIDWEGRRVLLDGSHNREGLATLRAYVEGDWRRPGERVTWILALTDSRDPSLLAACVPPGDAVMTVPFAAPAEMPWIRCAAPASFAAALRRPDAATAPDLRWALANTEGPLVIAGSLYLVAEALRTFPDWGRPPA